MESESENSYIRDYQPLLLSLDIEKAKRPLQAIRGSNEFFWRKKIRYFFFPVKAFWTSLRRHRIPSVVILEERRRLKRYSINPAWKRGFLALSTTVLIWWDNTREPLDEIVLAQCIQLSTFYVICAYNDKKIYVSEICHRLSVVSWFGPYIVMICTLSS